MIKIISAFIFTFFAFGLAAQSSLAGPKKMILAGDSWANLMCINGSFDNAFSKMAIKQVNIQNCNGTSRMGARADTWYNYSESKNVADALKKGDVDFVYLSLSGNDFLRFWTKTMSAADETVLFEKVALNMAKIIQEFQQLSPNTKILISGYDYGNFVDYSKIDGYEKTFERMGQPTPPELNRGILRFSEKISSLADNTQVFYIHHYGLMHYYFGNSKHGLLPKVTLAPEHISEPGNSNSYGGNIDLESSKKAMLQVVGLYSDPFHLSPTGFSHVADHAVFHYLGDWAK